MYELHYYNSVDRSWRKHSKKFTSKRIARAFAVDYFDSIKRDGIFGEPDRLYLARDGQLIEWSFSKKSNEWVVLA